MKLILSFLVIAQFTDLCFAQSLTITSLDRAGRLAWKNEVFTPLPMYEVLKTETLGGAWQHVAFVTNQTSYTISNELTTSTETTFLKVAWTNQPSVVFNYVFQEGGITTVTGQLNLSFSGPLPGSRTFTATDEYYMIPDHLDLHPMGTAPLVGTIFSKDGTTLLVCVKGGMGWFGEGAIYLEGTLARPGNSPAGIPTSYTGVIHQEGFVDLIIGNFVATREQ